MFSSLSRTNLFLAMLWPALAILCCLVLWTVTIWRTEAEAGRAEALLLKETDSYAEAYEQYVRRSIAQIDQITTQLKYGWEHSERATLIEDMYANGMFSDHVFVSVSIFDANGALRSSTRRGSAPASVAETAFFFQHKNNISTALRLDLAAAEFATPRPSVLFTRRLDRKNDDFDGVIVMAIDNAYLTSFVGESTLGRDGILALAAVGGETWIEQAGSSERARAPILDPVLIAGLSGKPGLVEGQAFRDGLARALGSRTSRVYPVTAIVARSLREGSAAARLAWEEGRYRAAAATAFLLLCASVASMLSLRAAAREREHEEAREAYRMATESANEGFYMAAPLRDRKGQIVDFRIIDCNERGATLYGLGRTDMIGRTVSTINRGGAGGELIDTYLQAMATGFFEEDRRMQDDDKLKIAWGRRRLVRVGDGLAITLQDISERKQHQSDLERLANEDVLTGLRNRSWLLGSIPALLEGAGRKSEGLALLFIDLDEFKHVNDSHGHGVGDQLLAAAARRLGTLLRPSDQVVRFGGDEFVVLLQPVQDEQGIGAVARRIVSSFETPFALEDGIQAMVGASIGISVFPRDGNSAETLIRHADIAMYAAKNEGKGQYRFFDSVLSGTATRRARLKGQLAGAIESDQFFLHYQPRVDPVSGVLLSMEALLRWRHPQSGMVAPGEFIPVAESSGLILQIGALVIEQACTQLAAWRDKGMLLVPVSINVSPKQLGGRGVVDQIKSALRRHGLEAAWLEVEITESAMMGDHAAVAAELAQLRALGIKLNMDDFGTGYSSLSHLRTLNMDVLKVDRAFTNELDQGEGKVFFEAIISMAHALRMTVVAEGVETGAQLRILQELGCDEVQGFHISRPLAAEEIEARFLAPLRSEAVGVREARLPVLRLCRA